MADNTTIERILDGAETVLRRQGHAGFTTRGVAEAAGVAPGNLAYHFPSKLELLRALIARLVSRYTQRLQQGLEASPPRSRPEVEGLVRWLLSDAIEPETIQLFVELWAMSLRDEVIREAVNDLYDQVMDNVAAALQRACPDADPQSLRELVQFLVVISEGSGVLYGARRARAVPFERLVDITLGVIGSIVPPLGYVTPPPGPPAPPESR